MRIDIKAVKADNEKLATDPIEENNKQKDAVQENIVEAKIDEKADNNEEK